MTSSVNFNPNYIFNFTISFNSDHTVPSGQNVAVQAARQTTRRVQRVAQGVKSAAAPAIKKKRGRKPLNRSQFECYHCNVKNSPEWRRGPSGPHTLCNACGLQYAKLIKKEVAMKENNGNCLARMKIKHILNV